MNTILFLGLSVVVTSALPSGQVTDEISDKNVVQRPRCKPYVDTSGPYGGSHVGNRFNDYNTARQNGDITAITLGHGKYIDSIRVRYGSGWAAQHGGLGGGESTFILNAGEKITGVKIWNGAWIDGLKFYTSSGRASSMYGRSGGSLEIANKPNCELSYISGNGNRHGHLDGLYLHWSCPC